MPLYPICSWFYLSSVRYLRYVFRRKSIGFPSSCSVPLSLRVSNVAFKYRNCLQAVLPFFLKVRFWGPFSRIYPSLPFPCVRRKWIFRISCRTFCLDYWRVYGIGSCASYPHIHKFLLHADTVLQAYVLIESLERDMFDERYTVDLYVVDLCTKFSGLGSLASYDGTYIMAVNTDDMITNLPALKQFLFLHK